MGSDIDTKLSLVSNQPYIKPWQHGRCASPNNPDSEEDDEQSGREHHLASIRCRVSDGQCKCHRSPEACGDQIGRSPGYKDKWQCVLKSTAASQGSSTISIYASRVKLFYSERRTLKECNFLLFEVIFYKISKCNDNTALYTAHLKIITLFIAEIILLLVIWNKKKYK